MRILAILWGHEPKQADWNRLAEARQAIGFEEKIQPVRALEGSSGRILCIGARPDWFCESAYVESTASKDLAEHLEWCLQPEEGAPGEEIARLLSEWMGGEVKYVGEEQYEQA